MNPIKNSILSKISNLIKINPKKEMNTEVIEKETKVPETKIFQWKKGDDFGKVVEVESEDDTYFNFKDGTRIYKKLRNEFMEIVKDINNLPFPPANDIKIGTPSHNTPTPTPSQNVNVQPAVIQPVVKQVEISPLEKLIIKLSSKNVETVDVKLNINLPRHEVFSMLLENGDETKEEMLNTISAVVTSQIQIDKLQSYINQEVLKFLNNYYND
jgi:hypothetical protein